MNKREMPKVKFEWPRRISITETRPCLRPTRTFPFEWPRRISITETSKLILVVYFFYRLSGHVGFRSLRQVTPSNLVIDASFEWPRRISITETLIVLWLIYSELFEWPRRISITETSVWPCLP